MLNNLDQLEHITEVMDVYRLKSPLSAQLELTDACNSACLHCYNYWRYLDTGKRIASDPHKLTSAHFMELLGFLSGNEVATVTFTGGEPFLRRDVLFDLIVAAKKSGMKVGVNTNGALIDDEDILRLKDAGTDFLLVSLLSDDPAVHNRIANSTSHAKTSQAITKLVEAGLSVAANMVVSTYNWSQVRQTAIYARNLGLCEFSATPVLPCPLAKNHLDLLLTSEQIKSVLNDLLWIRDEGMMVDVLEPLAHCMFTEVERLNFARFLNHRSCSAGISDMVISPEGDVRPCILATESVGNLLADGWEKCWGGLEVWCSPDLLDSDCLDCTAVDECGGGCRIAALAKSGKINGRDPYMSQPITGRICNDPDDGKPSTLLPETICRFPETAKIRLESFGCVLFCGRSFMFLDHDGAELVSHLKAYATFTPSSIISSVGVDEEVMYIFLSTLVERGFLTILSGEKR